MDIEKAKSHLKNWVRTQHLICSGTDFIFETVDQTQLERFQICLEAIGGKLDTVHAVGNWPMGPQRTFKILRAHACVPRPQGLEIQIYWATHGSLHTRFREISR